MYGPRAVLGVVQRELRVGRKAFAIYKQTRSATSARELCELRTALAA
ncbi:MAG: hypothetical protein ACRDLN_11550 [Solirubrobacteraceae bacterium]